jgi:hypothetical protein
MGRKSPLVEGFSGQALSSAAPERKYDYWAFISYSRKDQDWARALHQRMEGFHLPLHARPLRPAGVPAADRIRPVFLDQSELTVSPDLDARLRETLDRSRWLVLLASPSSAGSRYVDAEIRYLLETGRAEDVRIVVLEDGSAGTPFPPALRQEVDCTRREPLWLDARGMAKPNRELVIRLVAGMLGISFDALWQRDRRRRRRRWVTGLAAAILGIAAVGTAMHHQHRLDERHQPYQQTAAFHRFITAEVRALALREDPGFRDEDLHIEILRTDDLNGDSLLDFIVINWTRGFGGSGGVATAVYLAEELGRYREVLDLFGSSTPRIRASRTGRFADILAADHSIDGELVYSVYRWTGRDYELSHYEFCSGVLPDYCTDPVVIDPLDSDAAERLVIRSDASLRAFPAEDAPCIRPLGMHAATVHGVLADGSWYLVSVGKGQSAFVSRAQVQSRKP